MNRIITTSIVDPSIQQPLTGPSLDFLQDAYKQALNALLYGIFNATYGNGYALFGCEKIDNGSGNFDFNVGFLYDSVHEEIFLFEQKNVTITDTAVLTLKIANDVTADPVVFTDLVPRNVHNVRTLEVTDGAAGSGYFDYDDLVFVNELYHIVGGAGEPAYQNSYAATAYGARYKRDIPKNKLTLKGSATRATEAASVIFTLPAGFRPSVARYISMSVQIGAIFYPGLMVVATNGNVSVAHNAGSGSDIETVYFENVEFDLIG